MATVAEFTLAPAAFPLGTVFTDLPEATVTFERLVPTAEDAVSYFWVHDAAAERIGEHFGDPSGVRTLEVVDTGGTDHLLRCEWSDPDDGLFDALADPAVALESAVGTADGWRFVLRSGARDAIRNFQQFCAANDIPVSLEEVRDVDPAQSRGPLTEKQCEGLQLALEQGYYDSPRRASLEDVATELGITQQALSSRLRRGTRRLIQHTLKADRT
ncbi:MAG: helix-turn-helix domain-containing protein [Haloarculaceae archaeon]